MVLKDFLTSLGTEHYRIIEEIKSVAKATDAPPVVVFDVFAGVGPFSIPLARIGNCQVFANDLNPDSFYFLQENVRRNSSKKHPLTAKEIKCFNLDGREFIREVVAFSSCIFYPNRLISDNWIFNSLTYHLSRWSANASVPLRLRSFLTNRANELQNRFFSFFLRFYFFLWRTLSQL